MEANKKRISYGLVIGILIFAVCCNVTTRKKMRLPDSAEGVTSISVCETSCNYYGTIRKDVSDESGIKYIIDCLQRVEIDFSKPKQWWGYAGATGRTIILRYENGTERAVDMTVLGGENVIFCPSSDMDDPGYQGIWPDSENFFRDLDYPVIHLAEG